MAEMMGGPEGMDGGDDMMSLVRGASDQAIKGKNMRGEAVGSSVKACGASECINNKDGMCAGGEIEVGEDHLCGTYGSGKGDKTFQPIDKSKILDNAGQMPKKQDTTV